MAGQSPAIISQRLPGPQEDDRRAVTSSSMAEFLRVQPTAPHQFLPVCPEAWNLWGPLHHWERNDPPDIEGMPILHAGQEARDAEARGTSFTHGAESSRPADAKKGTKRDALSSCLGLGCLFPSHFA